MNSQEKRQQHSEELKAQSEGEMTENKYFIDAFQKQCAAKGKVVDTECITYNWAAGLVASIPNIVGFLCPDLLPDKDGLINLGALPEAYTVRPHMAGFIYAKDFMLMAHSGFRRGHINTACFLPGFIQLFWNLKDPRIQARIALDQDAVRINVDDRLYKEYDTWYGAIFKRDIKEIKDEIVKLRPPADLDAFDISFLFGDIYSLDIKWITKDGVKTFYAEEFRTDEITINVDGLEYYPARYIHAEYDLQKGCFRHLDGAIHYYNTDEYFERRDTDLNFDSKSRKKIKASSLKLFRLDGIISLDTWLEVVSYFLCGNPLVFEYFEGKYPDNLMSIIDYRRSGSINDNLE